MNGGFLVLRRSGGVWALPDVSVRAIDLGPAGLRVTTTAGAVVADEVIAFGQPLSVRRPGDIFAALWRQPCAGLAIFAGAPVVVVDPMAPPQPLLEEGDSNHAQ